MNQPVERDQTALDVAESDEIDLDEVDEAEILEALPPNTPAEVRAIVRRAFHSGPVPSPESLQRYEEVLPGLANRLVKMAENEQGLRSSDTSHFNWNTTFKIAASIVVSLAMVIGGVYCAVIGQPTVGGLIATSGVIAGVVQSYMQMKVKRSEEDNT